MGLALAPVHNALAARLRGELMALYVEDIDVVRLAELVPRAGRTGPIFTGVTR